MERNICSSVSTLCLDLHSAMKSICLILVLVAVASANMPYGFHYATGDAGGHQRSESGHGGNVAGSYSYIDPNGHLRQVSYTAGADGFKATGDIGVDRKTAADAAAIAAMAPKAPPAVLPVAPVAQWGHYGAHHYGGHHYGGHGKTYVSVW